MRCLCSAHAPYSKAVNGKNVKKNSNKQRDIIRLVLSIAAVILLNVLASFFFTRFDLTAEKRFTLADPTKNMLDSLDDVVYFKIYLDADFPQGGGELKRLRDESRIMLEEFRARAGDNIQYEFIDPFDNPSKKEREKFKKQLQEKGLKTILPALQGDGETGVTRQEFMPAGLVIYHGREIPIQLFYMNGDRVEVSEINRAIEKLEYEFSNAIRKLKKKRKPNIAILQGHGELDSLHTADYARTLREYYNVEYVTINGKLNAFRDTVQKADQFRRKYDVLVVPRPLKEIGPKDKFIIDQFIMYGGNVMWLLEPLDINMDSLAMLGRTLGLNDSVNVDDLLFKYGARVNNDVVLDLQHQYLTLNMAPVGSPPQFKQFPWPYWPLVQTQQDHPIVNGLDLIKFNYVGTIDTLETEPGIKKRIILRSSKYSRLLKAPVRIDLRQAFTKYNEQMFDKAYLPVGVLLEGTFESAYKDRIPPDIAGSKEVGFRAKSPFTRQLIFADGDIVNNNIRNGIIEDMGYDRASGYRFANKELLLNSMNYLCEDASLIGVRSRQLAIRVLDKKRIRQSRLKWQLYNNLLPIGIISAFGLLAWWLRKRKYGRKVSGNS